MGRRGAFPIRIAGWIAAFVMMLGCVRLADAGPRQAAARNTAVARALFCAHGGVGLVPRETPPGFELHFAVAVVEISSPRRIAGVKATEFSLFDEVKRVTTFTRVIAIEVFDPPRRSAEGAFAYYLDSPARPWDGTLPSGTVRLRVRVAISERPMGFIVLFRLSLGPFVVEGPVNGEWAT